MIKLHNREDAGRRLASDLGSLPGKDTIVLALPRGGVPVGYEIARILRAPLDVWIVRKIGVPWQPELGIGALAEGGYVHFSQQVVAHAGLSEGDLARGLETAWGDLEERIKRFRGHRPRPVVRGRNVILVDDGVATGATVRAAIRSVRSEGPKSLTLAVPVAAAETIRELIPEVDRMVWLLAPENLVSIAHWYEDFPQVLDAEAVALLERAHVAILERAHGEGAVRPARA